MTSSKEKSHLPLSPSEMATAFLPFCIEAKESVLSVYRNGEPQTENEGIAALYVVRLIDRIGRLFFRTMILWDRKDLPEAAILARSIVECSLLLQEVCNDPWPDCSFTANYNHAIKSEVIKTVTVLESYPVTEDAPYSKEALERTKEKAARLKNRLGNVRVKKITWTELAKRHQHAREYILLYRVLSSLTHPVALEYHSLSKDKSGTYHEGSLLNPLINALTLIVKRVVPDAMHSACERFQLHALNENMQGILLGGIKTRFWAVRRLETLSEDNL